MVPPDSSFIKCYRVIIVCVVFLFIAGCGVKVGVFHTVGQGETLWRIAKTYDVELQEVAELNNIQNSRQIRRGQRIFIPGVARARKVEPYFLPKGKGGSTQVRAREGKIRVERGKFAWPLKGKLLSPFGMRNGRRHNGIDIKGRKGAEIRASADGEAVYSGDKISEYGNMVILKHSGNFFTIYAHNSRNLVKEHHKVKKGDAIALVGDTGNATGYHLHFEIRSGKKRRNPLFFLP
ncbi:MAG: peptidoglycan DD-metalloendopeptidase family protein [Deltaproteobacteria bacterium]|nr:peptidoglycan DD-metalloendopeptidase family protein [Deltaproteobacteria bacterium]